jgi:hypothetical protein
MEGASNGKKQLGENIKKFDKGLHLHLMARVDRKYFSL